MSSFKAIVNLDLDGVIYPFHQIIAEYAKEITHTYRYLTTEPREWNYWSEWGMTKSEWLALFRKGVQDKIIWRTGRPRDGARELMWNLSHDNYYVRIVTTRLNLKLSHRVVQESTAAWLDENNLPYREIVYVGVGSSKADFRADYAIDDSLENADEMNKAGIKTYLLTRSWNADRPTISPRVKSLNEFYERITGKQTVGEARIRDPQPEGRNVGEDDWLLDFRPSSTSYSGRVDSVVRESFERVGVPGEC